MRLLFLYMLLYTLPGNAHQGAFPFDSEILSKFAQYKDFVMPKYSNGRFTYFNTKTGKQAFKGAFDTAYPFVKSAAVVVVNEKIGIIGRDGKWLKQPVYDGFKMPSYETHIVILLKAGGDPGKEYTYDLYNLKENPGYIGCAMPLGPQYYGFKDAQGKWGIKTRDGITTFKPAFDSIAHAYNDKIVVYINGKVGVVTGTGDVFLPFEYTGVSDSLHYAEHPVTGFLKDGEWYYYDLNQQVASLIVKSKQRCDQMGLALKNTIGLYLTEAGYNILYKDGTTLPNDYDMITQNGLVATKGNNAYILNEDKSAYLYYTK